MNAVKPIVMQDITISAKVKPTHVFSELKAQSDPAYVSLAPTGTIDFSTKAGQDSARAALKKAMGGFGGGVKGRMQFTVELDAQGAITNISAKTYGSGKSYPVWTSHSSTYGDETKPAKTKEEAKAAAQEGANVINAMTFKPTGKPTVLKITLLFA